MRAVFYNPLRNCNKHTDLCLFKLNFNAAQLKAILNIKRVLAKAAKSNTGMKRWLKVVI